MVIKGDKSLSPFAAPSEGRSTLRQALPQILAVCVKNVLLLGFGMTLGFPTILIPSLYRKAEGDPRIPEEPIQLGEEAISWIGSINLICVPVGCLLSGAVTQPIGRKRAMQLVNLPFLAAWLLFYFSTAAWQIFLALCITGVTGGLLEAPTLTYVAEITQPSLRGILASTSTVAVISGILIQFLLGTFFLWRAVAVLSCCVPVTSFILLFFVPESPHWLVSKNRFLDARRSLAWLRGWTDIAEIEPEFRELSGRIAQQRQHRSAHWQLYTKKNFLWPFGLVAFTFFLGHFSGMTTVQTYAIKIFSALKAPIDKYYATIALGAAEVVGCVLSACLIHYVGKRAMNVFSLVGCGACFLAVATHVHLLGLRNFDSVLESSRKEDTWVPTSLLVLSAFFTHSGIRILPWILVGEVYTTETRATASGLSGGVSYIFGFVSNKIFLKMVAVITLPGTFWLYGGLCFGGCVVLYFVLPETEGKSLFEITEHFAGHSKLDNRVFRRKRTAGSGEINTGFKADEENVNHESKL